MKLITYIREFPVRFSLLVKLNLDWISCVLLMAWGVVSYNYFFNYDTFYLPYALIIDHYTNLSFFGWIFLVANYYELRTWGRITVGGYTGMLMVNTYQLHVGFDEGFYFIIWIGMVFFVVFLSYLYYAVSFINKLFE